MLQTDPFTRTPGRAGEAYIDMHYADKVIKSFKSSASEKYVYKIVGLRGSGKSVEYGEILEEMRKEPDWLIYTLSAAGSPSETLFSLLSEEDFVDEQIHKETKMTLGKAKTSVLLAEGSAETSKTISSEPDPRRFSLEAELKKMIIKAAENGYKVLVGIDDISRTPEMVKFLSLWGDLVLDKRVSVYLLCTGLYHNIEDFAKEKHLSFFIRGDAIEIKGLDLHSIAAKYVEFLEISNAEAVKMAKFTKGYPYAYQVLGSLYYEKNGVGNFETLIPEFQRILFRDSYDLIWASLTEAEKKFVKSLFLTNGKASEIKAQMKHESGYSSLRERLSNKHLLNTSERGMVRIDLPQFKEYVEIWHME